MISKSLAAGLSGLFVLTSMGVAGEREISESSREKFQKVVSDTKKMSLPLSDSRKLAREYGLDILDVTWEDTGRTKGSVYGPNISDVSIQVHLTDENGKIAQAVTMPVVRYPNFVDKSADLAPSKFFLRVGNERGRGVNKLTPVTLSEYLDNFRKYLTKPGSWKGDGQSLLAPRDSHVLVSAQVSFLPIPEGDGAKATFNPVLFNYQSYEQNPAVLAILATREGTSATIIDNKRDGFIEGRRGSWGQRLFFNAGGMRASLTGTRQSEFAAAGGNSGSGSVAANGESGLNMVLLIQVPLVHRERPLRMVAYSLESAVPTTRGGNARVENAVIGHGAFEGPFTEVDDLAIKRDERFPIRVTVQFYKATNNANLTADDLKGIRAQIDRVFKNADYVGSLVTEGKTARPTEHSGPNVYRNPRWWPTFWERYSTSNRLSEEEGVALLKKTYGNDWVRMTKSEQRLADALKYAAERQRTKTSGSEE